MLRARGFPKGPPPDRGPGCKVSDASRISLRFLSGPNAPFIEELYAKYLENAASVDPSWRSFFDDLKDDAATVLQDIRGASWSPRERTVEIGNGYEEEATTTDTVRPRAAAGDRKKAAVDSLRAMMLIRAYRVRAAISKPISIRWISSRAASMPSSIPGPMVSPKPTSTARSSSTTCSA